MKATAETTTAPPRAQRNEEAAALLFALLNAGNIDVENGVLVAPLTNELRDRLERFELDGDADAEHGDENDEPNGDEQEDADGDEDAFRIEAGLPEPQRGPGEACTPVMVPDYRADDVRNTQRLGRGA